ncbi:MAG TPA: ATP-binding protein [Micromonosporaceae bacterium]|nr:ATP-binding protein [Micromonosporaceae bacterium]
MTDEVPGSATVLGTVTLHPHEQPETGWCRIRDLAQAGGLTPLAAARLALAATGPADMSSGPSVVELLRVTDENGPRVQAIIRGGAGGRLVPIPEDLVDASFARASAAGTWEQVLSVAAERDGVSHRWSWTSLSDRAAHASSTRELLAAALVAVGQDCVDPGLVDRETTELRLELNETNRGMLALHADLSARQDELELARAAADEASRMKAAFLANMSHEIRSPMNAVVGFNSLLLETDLDAEQVGYAGAVQTAGRHLLGVIDDILDFSKLESGQLALEDVVFDLYACVEDAVGMLALKAAEKNLPVVALFAPGTPAIVRGDPLRLGQILVNLIANAVNFTTEGHVTVEVTHEPATPTSQCLTFRITDTGRGIPPDTLGRLFMPFTQADASITRSHGGTGLGLSICRQLAGQMGGAVSVESTINQGSTFTCTIQTPVGAAEGSAGDAGLLAGTDVLVVHQHPLIVEAVSRHLVSWGAEVATASSIDDALHQSGDGDPVDLVLVDATGLETFANDLARLSDAHRDPPIIAITELTARRNPAVVGQISVARPIRRANLRDVVIAALGRTDGPTPSVQVRAGLDPAAEPPPPVPEQNQPTRRVLYVDDNTMMVELVQRILGNDAHVMLYTAPDGATALRLAVEHLPDLILLDLNLTDVRGDVLLGEFQTNVDTRAIPVVMVSGDAAPATIERLARLGAAGYLTKPFQAAQLRQLVHGAGYRAAFAGQPSPE